MAQVDDFLAEMLPHWKRAYRALCGGDVEPWAAIWSTRDPVSLFGAAGSASGTDDVRRVQEWVAGHFAGHVDEKQELIAAGASGDLAYTVAFEHKTVDTPSGERATYTLRTTHVFRRENGTWRIVHRHGDRPPCAARPGDEGTPPRCSPPRCRWPTALASIHDLTAYEETPGGPILPLPATTVFKAPRG